MNWIKGIVKFWKTIQIILIYIISIFLVYFMFPREGKFKYEYSKNKPWMHETLVAPFDFPVYKTDQQVQRENNVEREVTARHEGLRVGLSPELPHEIKREIIITLIDHISFNSVRKVCTIHGAIPPTIFELHSSLR